MLGDLATLTHVQHLESFRRCCWFQEALRTRAILIGS